MKKYTIPEWFLKLKKYNKYDLERAYYFCDRYSKNQLKKISKKEFCQIIKDCKKDKYPLSDSDLENMAFIDKNIEDYTEELLELKISYLDKIYDNENTRQNIIDQKAHNILNILYRLNFCFLFFYFLFSKSINSKAIYKT